MGQVSIIFDFPQKKVRPNFGGARPIVGFHPIVYSGVERQGKPYSEAK